MSIQAPYWRSAVELISRRNYSGMILFWGFWCRNSALTHQRQWRRCCECHKAAMLLMLLKTNCTETRSLSKSRQAFLCFSVFGSYNSRRTFSWAESGVWVLDVGCFLICCGAKLQRMSHRAMIYFSLHPVQFKATISKKTETVIKHILLLSMAFPSSSRFSNNLTVRCFFPIKRLKVHLSQPIY